MKIVSIFIICSLFVCLSIAQEEPVSLSKIGVYRSTFHNIYYNTSSTIQMGNVVYQDGIQLCQDDTCYNTETVLGEAHFNLDRAYNILTGLIGMDDKSTISKEVALTLIGDDKELQKITMNPADLPINVNLNVSGVRRLTLKSVRGERCERLYIDLANMVLSKVPKM